MPRYIIIENHTGYIWGDSADFAPNAQSDLSPTDAVRLLEESLDECGYSYYETHTSNTSDGFTVYRADINGNEVLPIVENGQDRNTIELVERNCKYITMVLRCN